MTLDEKLGHCYNVIVMTARKGFLNARGLRGCYTHWLGRELGKEVRTFTGYVSEGAIKHGTHIGLVLEHYLRIHTTLTQLVQKHLDHGENKAEFISEVKRLEQVHIVTKAENDRLRRKEFSGDYELAGIHLIHWDKVPEGNRVYLRKKLAGQVANRNAFMGA